MAVMVLSLAPRVGQGAAPGRQAIFEKIRQALPPSRKTRTSRARSASACEGVLFSVEPARQFDCLSVPAGRSHEQVRPVNSGTRQEILSWKNGRAAVLPVAQYSVPIAGTDVTYEDLSMRYLYWPAAKVVRDDAASTVKGRDCWIIRIPNPNPKVGQYAWVRVWIDKENGAMW